MVNLILIFIFIFLFGLTIGSFLNCLIWRLHTGEGMWNRSYCPKCKHQIAGYDNIPILSFIILGGKCRHCRQKISWQYPLVEFITGILFVISFIINLNHYLLNFLPNFQFSPAAGQAIFNFQTIFNSSIFNNLIIQNSFIIHNSKFIIQLFRDWFLISVMIIIFIYDLRWYLILDVVTLPAYAIVIILNLVMGISWQNMAISGIIGGSFFLIQFLISQGKWIGGGDIRLGALMGFALGWPNILVAILLAYITGSVVGLILILTRQKKWGSKVPLGIFLSTATIITLFWGEKIINWYWQLFRF